MAIYYCDQSGLYPTYSGAAWGEAFDGDGTSKLKATPALASIVLSTNTTGSIPITIMGSTAIAVSSGASIATTCDNIATAINAASNIVVVTSVTNSVPPISFLIRARGPGTGAAANTVELMTRSGSPNFNYATNSASVIVANTGGWIAAPPTINQFSGSTGGAWGVWRSGYSVNGLIVGGYGCLFSGYNTSTRLGPLSGNPLTINDTCYVRSNNTTVTFTGSMSTGANYAFNVNGNFIIDTGTIWPGDTGYYKFYTNGAFFIYFNSLSNTSLNIFCSDPSRFLMEMGPLQSQSVELNLAASGNSNSSFSWSGMTINDYTLLNNSSFKIGGSIYSGSNCDTSASNMVYNIYTNKFPQVISGSQGSNTYNHLDNITINALSFLGTPSVGIFPTTHVTASTSKMVASNIFVNVGGTKPYVVLGSVAAAALPKASLDIRNVTGCLPANSSLLGTYTVTAGDSNAFILQQDVGGLGFQYDCPDYTSTVAIDPTLPYLDCKTISDDYFSNQITWPGSLLQSTTIRHTGKEVFLTSVAGGLSYTNVVLQLLIDPTINLPLLTSFHIYMAVSYKDSTGLSRRVTTKGLGSATAASEVTWAKGSYTTYIPISITIALPVASKANSKIDVSLYLTRPNPGSAGTPVKFFINPEPYLT